MRCQVGYVRLFAQNLQRVLTKAIFLPWEQAVRRHHVRPYVCSWFLVQVSQQCLTTSSLLVDLHKTLYVLTNAHHVCRRSVRAKGCHFSVNPSLIDCLRKDFVRVNMNLDNNGSTRRTEPNAGATSASSEQAAIDVFQCWSQLSRTCQQKANLQTDEWMNEVLFHGSRR